MKIWELNHLNKRTTIVTKSSKTIAAFEVYVVIKFIRQNYSYLTSNPTLSQKYAIFANVRARVNDDDQA